MFSSTSEISTIYPVSIYEVLIGFISGFINSGDLLSLLLDIICENKTILRDLFDSNNKCLSYRG